MNFFPKPYKLINKIQHYNWGTKNEKAYIPKLLGIGVIPDLPYAELWIGAHPKASSEILLDGKNIPLNEVIDEHPVEILGEYVVSKFGNQLPFLLKVLSAANALSIQTHPDKEQAKKLHLSDPQNYPDDNHKPEIAIAIDQLTAIAGFRPVKEIVAKLKSNPEIFEFAEDNLYNKIITAKSEDELKALLEDLYSRIMKQSSDKEKLANVIEKLIQKISGKENLSPEEYQFIKQYNLFGNDIGLLSFFFFNIIQMKPGQAIFTDAGVPHAYIEGNMIECMANSDNVVRAGLTNKFKDVDTLLDIIKYDFSEYKILNKKQESGDVIYKTDAAEFEVAVYSQKPGLNQLLNSENKPVIFLIMNGCVEIKWEHDGKQYSETFRKGESFLFPAVLNEYRLSCIEDAIFIIVRVP